MRKPERRIAQLETEWIGVYLQCEEIYFPEENQIESRWFICSDNGADQFCGSYRPSRSEIEEFAIACRR